MASPLIWLMASELVNTTGCELLIDAEASSGDDFIFRQRPQEGRLGRMRTRQRLHRQPANGAVATGDALEMGAIDDALAPALRLRVNRDLARTVPDPHLAGGDGDGDPLSDQPPGNGVGVGVDLNRALLGAGINDFSVYREHESLDGCRFPVFLRGEHDHKGRRSELLEDTSDVHTAIGKLRRSARA